MSLSKYAHMSIRVNDTPLLEVQSADWTETSRHKMVEDVPAGIGMLKSRLPVKVAGSVNLRVPRGGHEFDFRKAARKGEMVTVRRVDLDAIADAICHFTEIKYSDNFSEDRTCSVSFEGALPPEGDE